jgi:hypothetical protein
MKFCKENGSGICKPITCKTSCSIGDELRKSLIFKKCGECKLMEQGVVDGINICKDSNCLTGEKVIFIRENELAKIDKKNLIC